MSAAYRVLDIETVVDDRYWTRPPGKWVEAPVEDEYVALPSGGMVHRSQMEGRGIPTMWRQEDPFPPPQAHRVVAIAWVELSGDDNEWYKFQRVEQHCVWSHRKPDMPVAADMYERGLLDVFNEAQTNDEATLVTWNGRTFDLPVINMRSFLHGIACEWYYKERDLRYRYSEACHCDLMDVFTDFGAARAMKLGDVARLIGLPGKTGEVSGANVASFYDKGDDDPADMKKVGDYCLSDALQTALLFARSRFHKGMISLDHYRKIVLPSFADVMQERMGVHIEDLHMIGRS